MDEETVTPEEAPELLEETPVEEEFVLIAEEPVVVELEEEVVEVPKPKKPATPKAPKPATSGVPPTTYAVVGGEEQDEVHLSRAIYKNMRQKRSLTVHHIQRRLKEWGFRDAYSERDGFYGDLTKKSVTEFQESLGLEVTGMMDAETMTRLFEGDTNVTVHLS
jgi:hypothetical protein